MAKHGTAYFDSAGRYFLTAEEATMSDLAGILGRVGEGDSLAPGIAKLLYQKRRQIEQVFAEHDHMVPAIPRIDDVPSISKIAPFVRAAS